MLISFKVENYRSIKESVKIDFNLIERIDKKDLPDNSFEIDKSRLLKSLILYGRNASGKSNILMAIEEFKDIVCESDNYKLDRPIYEHDPYRFDSETQDKPTSFEIDFYGMISLTRYLYSISFTSERIIEESLFFYPNDVKTKLYIRQQDKISYGESFKGVKKDIEANLLKNQLFLSKSASNNIKYLDEVYLTISKNFITAVFNTDDLDLNYLKKDLRYRINDPKLKINLKKLLQCGDTGLIDYELEANKENNSNVWGTNATIEIYDEKLNENYEMQTYHRMFNKSKEFGISKLNVDDESLGTQKLITLGIKVIDTLAFGGIIIIDELDKGLHPLLTRMLIKLFHSKKNNPKNAQLIFATHDGTLMDLELFRRDQICFIEKEYEGNTTITKLSDYRGVRKGIPLEKWYLSGRFKGIPVINDVELEF